MVNLGRPMYNVVLSNFKNVFVSRCIYKRQNKHSFKCFIYKFMLSYECHFFSKWILYVRTVVVLLSYWTKFSHGMQPYIRNVSITDNHCVTGRSGHPILTMIDKRHTSECRIASYAGVKKMFSNHKNDRNQNVLALFLLQTSGHNSWRWKEILGKVYVQIIEDLLFHDIICWIDGKIWLNKLWKHVHYPFCRKFTFLLENWEFYWPA